MERRHPKTLQCSNKRVPDGLTEAFIERMKELRSTLKHDYLMTQLLTKFVSADTEPALVRRARAIDKWLWTEEINKSTNERLLLTHGEYQILPRVSFERFITLCRDIIRDIIGDTAPIEALIGSFSGGASTSRNRTESHPAQKYLGEAHVTSRCLEEIVPLIRDEIPLWLMGEEAPSIVVVPGNVMFTVPKKTDIDRVACKEPDLNMFVQKGIGKFFRSSLRRIGINLNDQSINRSLARIGSIDGSVATLDLSSASDSVTSGIVQLLLPECWFTLLDASRCQTTIIDGHEHRNEMFSSMGNGFTFELESLLFYSLARAVCYVRGVSGRVSVYGDDIICPTGAAEDLIHVLEFFGFSTNMEKSFIQGKFRESCGGHYHDGYDITPFYLRAPIERLTDLIHVANQLREWATDHNIIDHEIEDIWLWLKGYVPRELWGGENTSFKYQLVSYDIPTKRLYPETNRKETGYGGYLHWHNASWDRLSTALVVYQPGLDSSWSLSPWLIPKEGIETSSYRTDLGRFRMKKVLTPAVPRLPALFSHELG